MTTLWTRSKLMLVGAALLLLSRQAVMAEKIALEILEAEERAQPVRDFPVSVGVVFPDGVLKSVLGGAVVDEEGERVPFEAEATGWWDPEKTRVKWLLLHFRASTDRKYFFDTTKSPLHPGGKPIAAVGADRITVDTGALRVGLATVKPSLFESVILRGAPVLGADADSLILVADDGETQTPGRLEDWSLALEESTPARATVRANGIFRFPNGDPLAQVGLRYQFFKGETFVRVYHTLTWMVKDTAIGAREYAVGLRPSLGEKGTLLVGESDHTDAHTSVPWTPATVATALQDAPEHFAIQAADKPVKEGRHLGGWSALAGEDDRGVSIALREAWQTWPTAFTARDGALCVEFWPSEGPRMGFRPEDIMPPDFFNDAKLWNRFKWIDGKGHFIHEYSSHPHFLYTAEGAAQTHELTIFFYDRNSRRKTAELNSLTQHPVVVRQDPRSAMRVPFMGFDIEPVREDYPTIERAIEQIGRMAVARWPKTHDYGLWRYGMVRWAGSGVSYRWMDGHQYDLPMIPWLLFMRGGGRHWYEEGEATARFAMDVATNHFNTRGLPTGYQATAAGLPFPWHGTFLSKGPKVHFLAYYYHLTGYRRAKEALDEVIAGNKRKASKEFSDPEHPHRGGHGRELYNMNAFWVKAYEETWDPEIKELAREWLGLTMDREYNPELNVFRAPSIFLFTGLVQQHRLWDDSRLKALMLKNLGGPGYPDLPDGGVYSAENAPGCGWAHRVTGDRRYAKVGWDAARTLADLVPDHDWSSRGVPTYPILGNAFVRQFLLPIIVGYSHAARLGLEQSDTFDLRDTFIGLPYVRGGGRRGNLYLRPRQDGDLEVRFIFSGVWGRSPGTDIEVKALNAAGRELARANFPLRPRVEIRDRFYPWGWFVPNRGQMTLTGARKGEVYRLVIEGESKDHLLVLALADADLVQQVSPEENVYFYNLAGQYYVGTRVFTEATEDVITVTNPYAQPFSIRDADSGELLHRFTMADPKRGTFPVGKGRMLRITMTGRMDGRRFKGVSPFLARTRADWFEPEQGLP